MTKTKSKRRETMK